MTEYQVELFVMTISAALGIYVAEARLSFIRIAGSLKEKLLMDQDNTALKHKKQSVANQIRLLNIALYGLFLLGMLASFSALCARVKAEVFFALLLSEFLYLLLIHAISDIRHWK